MTFSKNPGFKTFLTQLTLAQSLDICTFEALMLFFSYINWDLPEGSMLALQATNTR